MVFIPKSHILIEKYLSKSSGKPVSWEDFLKIRSKELRFSSASKMKRSYVDYCLTYSASIGLSVALMKGIYGPALIEELVYSRNPFLALLPKTSYVSYAFPISMPLGKSD